MNLIIAGDRNFDDYWTLTVWAGRIDRCWPVDEVVSGCARGADTLGERWAKERELALRQFPAQWDKHGKAAGPIRNREMADYADMLLAFIAPHSKGTLNMVETMRKLGKPAMVVPVEV